MCYCELYRTEVRITTMYSNNTIYNFKCYLYFYFVQKGPQLRFQPNTSTWKYRWLTYQIPYGMSFCLENMNFIWRSNCILDSASASQSKWRSTVSYSLSPAASWIRSCSVFRREVVCFLRLPWVYQTYQLNDINLSLGNLVVVGLEQTFTNTSLNPTVWPRCQ